MFDPNVPEHLKERLELGLEAKKALENKAFRAWYQNAFVGLLSFLLSCPPHEKNKILRTVDCLRVLNDMHMSMYNTAIEAKQIYEAIYLREEEQQHGQQQQAVNAGGQVHRPTELADQAIRNTEDGFILDEVMPEDDGM